MSIFVSRRLSTLALTVLLANVLVSAEPPRLRSLHGTWQFKLDPHDVGEDHQWFSRPLGEETIELPGTTDLAGKGYRLDRKTMTYPGPIRQSEVPTRGTVQRFDHTGSLVRQWAYIGKAWYQRTIDVPQAWAGRHVQLRLERVMWGTKVWVDDRPVGSYDSLVAEHRYDLGQLKPGQHGLTVRVDNDLVHNIGLIGHAYGPETQSRWNGIVGDIQLTATEPVFIRRVRVNPAADRKTVSAVLTIHNTTNQPLQGHLSLGIDSEKGSEVVGSIDTVVQIQPGEQRVEKTISVDKPVQAWDEFNTTRYQLLTKLETEAGHHDHRELFGFRHIARKGRHILVNGRRIFLRGTLDCCVYPKTGHPPVTVSQWLGVLGTIKQYGFNHVRFHSWCPPAAAFEAADRLGIYLAPETPFWVDDWVAGVSTQPKPLGRDPRVTQYIRNEIRRIADVYGNHPSFAFFCIGNEFGNSGTDWNVANQLIAEAKEYDARRLYNATTARKRVAADDYWVTHTTGKSTRGVGPAHTDWDFGPAAAATDLPLVAHETGQRPVFPDYDGLLPKFTGPLKPYNLERFRQMAIDNGLADQIPDFTRASARHQMTQYKAEHEAMLRTADYAGYQLLMLNDFTGQSEALVGILDPFWQSKGAIGVEDVRQWNSPTVLLARFNTFSWTTADTFEADVEVAHYGPDDITSAQVKWSLHAADDRVLDTGTFQPADLPTGRLTRVGSVALPLAKIPAPAIVYFELRMGQTTNRWKLGVYPSDTKPTEATEDILITDRFDESTVDLLDDGARVLYLSRWLKNKHSGGYGFYSQYWSAGWWGNEFSLLGVKSDSTHPALAAFPTDGHSDWFWFDPIDGGVSIDLTGVMPSGYKPIIQGVANFHYNRLLGQLFEVRVGRGRLMVCGYDLKNNLADRPAARQLRHSILQYMASDRFQPPHALADKQALELLALPLLKRLGITASADSQVDGYEAANAIDGDPNTLWHTTWTGNVPSHPHELIIDLRQPRKLTGLTYLPRQDQANGRIAKYAVYVSSDGEHWGNPATEGEWPDDAKQKSIVLDRPVTARYVKLVALSEVKGQPFTSAAEIDVILSKRKP